jgi:hypothetical protein
MALNYKSNQSDSVIKEAKNNDIVTNVVAEASLKGEVRKTETDKEVLDSRSETEKLKDRIEEIKSEKKRWRDVGNLGHVGIAAMAIFMGSLEFAAAVSQGELANGGWHPIAIYEGELAALSIGSSLLIEKMVRNGIKRLKSEAEQIIEKLHGMGVYEIDDKLSRLQAKNASERFSRVRRSVIRRLKNQGQKKEEEAEKAT